MTDKFTLRDIVVYTLLGIVVLYFFDFYFSSENNLILKRFNYESNKIFILLFPISYLIGHILMGIDDLIFNGILLRFFPKEKPLKNKFWQAYNFLFFGYRNIGIRHNLQIDNNSYFKTCDKLISENKYYKIEYYQIISDLFKGFFLVLISSVFYDIYMGNFIFWKLGLVLIVWYRARMFSTYLVKMVKRNMS
jgi:hypothetical protein